MITPKLETCKSGERPQARVSNGYCNFAAPGHNKVNNIKTRIKRWNP